MTSIAMTFRSAVVTLLALASLAPSAFAASGPLEVRPSQGPQGSSAILHAAGFTAGEQVRVYVDGRHVETLDAAGGTAADVVQMPAADGVHRIVLRGSASQRTAAGTFTTTAASDPARPAFIVSPRALGPSGDATWPYAAEYLVANFPAHSAIDAVYPWSEPDGAGGCNFSGYFGFRIGRADAHGSFKGDDTWRFGCQSVITLGISLPWGEDEAATVIAADALIQPAAGYTASRRVRAVPSVSVHDGPIFLLGTGFTPGAAVSLDEQWVPTPTAVGNAGSDGSVVTREDVGRPPEFEQEYKLRQGSSYGAAAAWRQEDATIDPVAAASNDLVTAGATTTIVAAGLTPGAAALKLRDGAATDTTLATPTVAADGTLQALVTIPAATSPGGHAVEVSQDGVARAHASLAVGTAAGTFATPAARIPDPDLGVVALQPGEAPQERPIEVCNDGADAAEFALSDDNDGVTIAPSTLSIPAGECAAATVTVSGGAATSSREHVTITAQSGGASATATLDRLVRTVTIEAVATGPMDLTAPFALEGTTEPGAQVEVLALASGDGVRSLGWSESADRSGRWRLAPDMPPRGTHLRFVAIPAELSVDDDRSRYPTAAGTVYGSRFGRWFEGLLRYDLSTSRTVFRGVGEPDAGVEDVFVLDPDTTYDSFDGAGYLEVVDTDGNHWQDVYPDAEPRDGGGMFPGGDLVAELRSIVGHYAAPTELHRRYEAEGGGRALTVIDRFQNTGFAPRTYRVAFVSNGGAPPADHRFRLSDGTAWENPADGAILREGAAVDEQGFVALRDQGGPAAHGVGFVGWQQAPDRVRLRPGSRDEVVLEYTITVPPESSVELRHAVGAAATDASALAWAGGGADTTPPELTVTNPPSTGLTTSSREITASGTVTDALGTPAVSVAVVDPDDNDLVLVSPEQATVAANGTWSAAVTLPDDDGDYYLRVIADDGNGNTTQPDLRSVVLRRKPTATTRDAVEITASGAKVGAGLNANGRPTTYAVQYGATTAYGSEVAGGDTVTGSADVVRTLALQGLEPETTYHYRVVATNSAGTTAGADRMFRTLADTSPGDGDGDGEDDGGGGDGSGDGGDGSGDHGGGVGSGSGGGGDAGDGSAGDTGPLAPPIDPPAFGPFPSARGPAVPAPALLRGTRLRDVLRKGLPLDFDLTGTRCEGGCPLAVRVLVDRRTARRARPAAGRAKLVVVGSRRVVFRDDVRVRVTVRLTKRARARLARVKRVALVVRTSLTDAAGQRADAERRIALRR